MTFLPVLHQSPKDSAAFTADVHLNNGIVFCAKLLSSAAAQMAPEQTKLLVGAGGVRHYRLGNEIILLPPIKDPKAKPWIDWVCGDYDRVWWVITLAWFLDKELATRFGDGMPQHPLQLRANNWVKQGLTKVFPKTGVKKPRDFPVVLPPTTAVLVADNPIDAYRSHYKELMRSGAARLKWTGRDMPTWLSANVQAKECHTCGSTADPRMCPLNGCPLKGNYNI
jgi:hypothetical protein